MHSGSDRKIEKNASGQGDLKATAVLLLSQDTVRVQSLLQC